MDLFEHMVFPATPLAGATCRFTLSGATRYLDESECPICALERSRAEVERLRDALVGMVCQFAGWNEAVGGHDTMCMGALEEAFDALGWQDPHPDPEACCDEPGCMKQHSCGIPTAAGYRCVCGQHYRQLDEEMARAANEGGE